MKKIGWSILIGLLTIVSLTAQEKISDNEKETTGPKNIIKIHPLDVLFSGGIGLGYERVIKSKTTIDFELFQQFNNLSFDNDLSELNYNLFFETDVRRYLSKRKMAPKGFFVGGGILTIYNNYNKLKNSNNNEVTNDVEELWVGAGVKTGYQWVFKKALKGITAEANATVDYRTRLGVFDRSTANEVGLLLRFTIGYSW